MGKVTSDVHGAWDETLHPRDDHGHFIAKGSKVRLPDGSVGKVVASRNSTIGAVITVRRKDGSTMHIPSSQTAKTTQKVSNDPVRQAGLPNDFLINHTPERGTVATPNNTTPGHRVAVAGGRTGTITAVRPASGTAAYVEDGSGSQRVGQLGRMTHLGAYQPDRGTPATLRNTQPGHHVAIVTPDGTGHKSILTGTVMGSHANPGTNVPTVTIARDGSGDISEHPLSNAAHLPTIAQLAHGSPPPRITTPIVADNARAKMIEQAMDKAVAEGKTTDAQFKDPKTGQWSMDRAAIHQQIVDEVYAKYANVPSDGKAIMAGGLPGAGKTTILKKTNDLSQYVTLNPDDMKEELIKRGLAPQVPGLTPMESVMLIHEESSDLTKMLAARAYRDHKNVMWDITMQSPGSVSGKLDQLKAEGYTTKGVFVSTTLDKSLENVRSRWAHGIEDYNKGEGFGGRYVPEHISRQAASDNALFRSKNEDTFSQFRRNMDDWELYDNSQNQKRLVTSKSHTLEVGDNESVPLSINDPQPGADKFLPPEATPEEPTPELPTSLDMPEPVGTAIGNDQAGAIVRVGDTVTANARPDVHQTVMGRTSDAGIRIQDPQGNESVVRPTQIARVNPNAAPTPEPKPEPEPGIPLTPGLPGTARAEMLSGIPAIPDSSAPDQKARARERLRTMSDRLSRQGYTSDATTLRQIANSNDLTVSHDGSVVGGSAIEGNGRSGPFQVVGSGSGTTLRPRNVQEPADKQRLVNAIAAASPYLAQPQVANHWNANPDARRSEARGVEDAWRANAPEPESSTDAVGSPLTVGVPVSYTTEDGERGTGTVAEINNNWGGGSSPHAIVINRDSGGQAVAPNNSVVSRAMTDAPATDGPAYGNGAPVRIGDRVAYGGRTGTVSNVHANGSVSVRRDGGNSALEGDDLVGGPGALTPLDASPTPEAGTPGGPATNAQIGQRVQFTNRVGQQVSGTVTHRSTIGDSTILQVEQDNGMYHAVNAESATMDGPGAPSTRDRRGNTIRVGDQVYVGSGTGKVVSISPDGQYLRVGRSTDGADPFGVSLDRVDSVAGFAPFGPPPQVGEKITVGGETGIVKEAVPSSARRGDWLVTYQRPDGGTGQTRLSNLFLNGPNAPKPMSSEGRPLAVGDHVTWGNSGMSGSGTGRVTALQPQLDNISSGSPATHNAIIQGDDGQERAVANNRLTHWQPAVGQEIMHNGERGTVTHIDPASADGQFPGAVQYKTADGQIRATDPKNIVPAPPPLPADLSMSPVPEETFRRWGPRAAEIAASGGPNLTAQGLNLNSGAHKEAFLKSLSDMYNGGDNGGIGKGGQYKVQANNVVNYGGTLQYNGTITGPDGDRVGNFTRTVIFKNGKPSELHNDLMQITPEHQGQGIARDFYRRQENWAIKNGVPKITVQANINIGGYTWGRLGYDWKSKPHGRTMTQSILRRIRNSTSSRNVRFGEGDRIQSVYGERPGKITAVHTTQWGSTNYDVKYDGEKEPQRVAASDIHAVPTDKTGQDLAKIQQKMSEDPTFVPTPYELGQIGYTPGQTTWPGKSAMLGTSWYGVKRLNPRNRLANATEEAPRSATASAFGGYGGDPKFHPGPKFPVKWSELEANSPTPPKVQMLGPDEEIHATQDRLDPEAVERYKAGTPGPTDNPEVAPRVAVTKDGCKHVLNGHHRILANRQQGKATPVLVLPGHVPDDTAAGEVPDGDPAALATFGWDESLHPRGKDGRYITKGGFVRLPNGVTGQVKGAKAGKDGSAVIQVKTDGPDGKTVSVAAKQLTEAPAGFRGMRVIQTHPSLPAAQLINAIKANGGFTYDPKTGGLLIPGKDKGFAVAVPGTEHIVGNGNVTRAAFKKAVVKVLTQYQPQIRGGAKLGGYFSEDRNAYMVELTDILPQEDPAGAIAEGKKRNQEGIYDIGNDKFIGTGGTGDA